MGVGSNCPTPPTLQLPLAHASKCIAFEETVCTKSWPVPAESHVSVVAAVAAAVMSIPDGHQPLYWVEQCLLQFASPRMMAASSEAGWRHRYIFNVHYCKVFTETWQNSVTFPWQFVPFSMTFNLPQKETWKVLHKHDDWFSYKWPITFVRSPFRDCHSVSQPFADLQHQWSVTWRCY